MKTKIIIFLTAVSFLLAAHNSSAQWTQQPTSTSQHLAGILHFPTLPITIVVGTGGIILKTTNNGTNWVTVTAPTSSSLSDITYTGVNTGWICGNGVVLKSTNGGSNWTSQTVPNRFWNSIYMLNDNTGWVCGATDSIIKTTNAGANWFVQENNLYPDETNYGIHFTNNLIGFMCGSNGTSNYYILRTINGGANWATAFTAPEYIQCIQMVNSTTGYAGGSSGKMHKTTNGGSNWTTTTIPGAGTGAIFSVHFPVTPDIGYAISVGGRIFKTTNAGANWIQMTSPVNVTLKGVRFKPSSNDIGTVVGNAGTIIWTTNGGGSFTGLQNEPGGVPSSFDLSQNYPNPFNPVTNISFSIPSSEFVNLTVYDMLGKEITNLVNEQLLAGTYKIDFNASQLSSGMYFYKLMSGSFSSTKKMILVK